MGKQRQSYAEENTGFSNYVEGWSFASLKGTLLLLLILIVNLKQKVVANLTIPSDAIPTYRSPSGNTSCVHLIQVKRSV